MFWADEIVRQVSASLVAALLSIVAGFIATWLGRRVRRSKQQATEDIEAIAQAARADDSTQREAILLALTQKLSVTQSQSSKEIAEALDRLRAAIPLAVEKKSPAVESLVSGYHEQALSQANAQFWFSVAAATAGFVWILYAGTDIKAENLISAVKTLPGVVMDGVAFLFFKQASETRQRATELYDRLRRDRQSGEFVALVAAIEDTRVRSAVQAQMALHMAGLQPSPIDLTNFLSATDSRERAAEAHAVRPALQDSQKS